MDRREGGIVLKKIQFVYNLVLISGVQPNYSDTHTYILQILFLYIRNTEYSSLCYTVGLCAVGLPWWLRR